MAAPISTSTTVREAVTRYPGAEAIFDAHGLIGCGGPNGPLEPIGFFAVVHHVDPQKLIDELNDFAASRPETGDDAHAPIDAGRHTYPLFLTTALIITLTTGITSGIAAALTGGWGGLQGEAWTATVQTHGHVQVFGFLALFIMGIALHVLPRFKGQAPPPRPLLLATYWTMLLGVAIRATTQPHGQGFLRVLLGASAVLELAGILLFACIVASVFWRARTKREPYDRFL